VLVLVTFCLPLLPVSPLSAQQPQRRLTLRGDGGPVTSLAFSPDGTTLAAGYLGWKAHDEAKRPWQVDHRVGRVLDREIQLWDVRTGKKAVSMRGRTPVIYSDPVWCLAFSPDGKTLASGQAASRRPGEPTVTPDHVMKASKTELDVVPWLEDQIVRAGQVFQKYLGFKENL
jgi:WD40 repeat protein